MNPKKRGAPKKYKDSEICNRIKEARYGKFTQQALATELGVSLQSVKNWEQGRNIPSDEILRIISQKCEVDFFWLKNLDTVSIINKSANMLSRFNPSNCEMVTLDDSIFYYNEKALPNELVAELCVLYPLIKNGHSLNEITDKKQYREYMESTTKNSIEFYMKNLNKKG